jgi:2-iminobutanoate/2-iminopropanoate deaminase
MSHHRDIISTPDAPAAIGPYSQAVKAGSFVFVSGQIALDAKTGTFHDGPVADQTKKALENLSAILTAAGCALSDVVSCTVYLTDMNDFAVMNDVFSSFFTKDAPSRAAVEVSRLPKDSRIEISCIAMRP